MHEIKGNKLLWESRADNLYNLIQFYIAPSSATCLSRKQTNAEQLEFIY